MWPARRPALAWSLAVSVALGACRDPRGGEPGPATHASSPPFADAHDDAGSDRLAVFLEAARTNLERPFPAGRAGASDFYFEAGRAIGASVSQGMPAAWNVALVLGVDDDRGARQALVTWAALPEARGYATYIVQGMAARPDRAYLPALRAIVEDPALAGELSAGMALGPSFGAALGRLARVSLHAQALDVAASLPGEGRALVARLAADHAGDLPNAKTLGALQCPPGEVRVEGEALALASVRLMALAALADEARWREVAGDARETPFIREWASRMASGRTGRGRERSPRASGDVMPCRGNR
jgi:hypothetical protein